MQLAKKHIEKFRETECERERASEQEGVKRKYNNDEK